MTLLFLTLFRNAYTAKGVAADRLFEAGHIDIVIEMGLQLTMRAFIKLDKPRYFCARPWRRFHETVWGLDRKGPVVFLVVCNF
jgi:hypothetical protein